MSAIIMGREILITGEEILYRDVVAGQPRPEWKKGPSINLTELQNLSSATRMQVSGNQYASLLALQSFFAQAFSDIDHDHDDQYDALGTAAGLVASEAAERLAADQGFQSSLNSEVQSRQDGDANLAEAISTLNASVAILNSWKSQMTTSDLDTMVNTLTEALEALQNLPEGSDVYGILNSKINRSEIVNTLDSVLTNVPASAYTVNALRQLILGLTADGIAETANRLWLTPALKVIYDAKMSGIKVNGVLQTLTDNVADLLINGLENPITTVTDGAIVLNKNSSVYSMYVTDAVSVTLNTTGVNTANFIRFYLRVNQTGYNAVTFPVNWTVYGSFYPSEIGEYIYEVTRGYNGDWNVRVIMRKIQSLSGTVNESEGTIVNSKIYYVDGELGLDTNNGLSWATPFVTVQKAIDTANPGDSVFVKGSIAGIKYLPTTLRTAGSARTASFIMKNNVNIYGGFAGTEASIYEREMLTYQYTLKLPKEDQIINVQLPKYKSILSGELGGNLTLGSATYGCRFTTTQMANNAYCVVWADLSADTVLNGFEIMGGYNNSGLAMSLSGTYDVNGSLITSNLYSHDNYSIRYTATGISCAGIHSKRCTSSMSMYNTVQHTSVYNENGSANAVAGIMGTNISSCYSAYNYTYTSSSGLQACIAGVSATLASNCYITGNRTYCNQGIISGSKPSGSLFGNSYGCFVVGNTNTSPAVGGGTAGVFGGTHYNSAFSLNTAIAWPAAYNATLINCMVGRNSSTGLSAVNTCTCYNTVFRNNESINGGAASSSTLINCSVLSNKATTAGAGTYNCALSNCVLYGNRLTSGATNNAYNSNSSVERYTAFENETRAGTGNVNLSLNNTGDANSPNFASLSSVAGIVDDGYQSNAEPLAGSCLIGAGLDSLNTETTAGSYDFRYKARKVGTIDIGAYEYQG